MQQPNSECRVPRRPSQSVYKQIDGGIPHHAYAVYDSTTPSRTSRIRRVLHHGTVCLHIVHNVRSTAIRVASLMAGKTQLNQLTGQHTRPVEHV